MEIFNRLRRYCGVARNNQLKARLGKPKGNSNYFVPSLRRGGRRMDGGGKKWYPRLLSGGSSEDAKLPSKQHRGLRREHQAGRSMA